MPILFLYFILEVFAYVFFVEHFGFLDTTLAYLLPSFLGLFLLGQWQSAAMIKLQNSFERGQEPAAEVIHTAMKFFGSLMLLPPLILTRILGFVFILPGIRHLIVFFAKAWLLKKIFSGQSSFVKFGPGAFTFYSQTRGFGRGSGADSARDVTESLDPNIIDIKPIQVEHQETKKDSDH